MSLKPSFLLAFIFAAGCTPVKQPNHFSDPVLVKIADFQDHRQTDSLRQYLQHANPIYRRQAALAFGSVQDSLAANDLGSRLLEDQDTLVQINAAFALGQTKGYLSVNALIPALTNKNPFVLREVLEALGKTATATEIPNLLTFSPQDSLAEAGHAWGIYRLGVRGLANEACMKRALELLHPSKGYSTQLGAAHFFSRANFQLPTEAPAELVTAGKSKYAEVRMVVANALRKFPVEKSLPIVAELLTDPDYRVRVNATRALRVFKWIDTKDLFRKALKDEQLNVAISASEIIRGNISIENADTVLAWARASQNKRAQAHLYEGVLGIKPTEVLTKEVIDVYEQSKDDYQKSWLLNALGKSPYTKDFLITVLQESKIKVIKTSAAAALVEINRNPKFDAKQKNNFAALYPRALLDGDVGVIISICDALKDPALGYKEIIKDFNFLQQVRSRLSLPRDLEAVQPLEETIAYFEGKVATPIAKTYNHPIVWDSVKQIPASQRVLLKTNKGDVEMVLFVEEEPGSVLNFVQLTNSKYFDGRFFHRVVPNFVAQAGCNRGDGYGSEDYSIRSEFTTRRYKTGSVGMASAGKDTEGTQWFITHSPTPHLDGGYTVFAEVTQGMEVVHQLEVGDQIISVSLIRN